MTTSFRLRGVWRVEGAGAETKVVIPWRFQASPAVFWACVLAAWAYGGVVLVKPFLLWSNAGLNGAILVPFLAAVLATLFIWVLVGHSLCFPLFAACGLARETVWRDGADLCVSRRCAGMSWWTWRYAVVDIGPLSAPARQPRARLGAEGGGLVVSGDDRPLRPDAEEDGSGAAFRGGGVSDGVAFLCEGRRVSVGAGLDEGQAARLAEVLALRFGLRLGTGPSGV